MLFLETKNILNDAAYPWQIYFQDSSSPSFDGMMILHDLIFFFLMFITFFVGFLLYASLINFGNKNISHKYTNHGTLIELIWTISPAMMLVMMAFPSFKLLYLLDEVISPSMTMKILGKQWYWSYEYSDFVNKNGENLEFDSYLVPENDLDMGQLRLLDVDNRIVLPIDTHIRFMVSGSDVIHDFAVPSLALKMDAMPGRLNQGSAMIQREGLFFGQCSEMCGIYHGFMPIQMEAVTLEKYLSWMESQI